MIWYSLQNLLFYDTSRIVSKNQDKNWNHISSIELFLDAGCMDTLSTAECKTMAGPACKNIKWALDNCAKTCGLGLEHGDLC